MTLLICRYTHLRAALRKSHIYFAAITHWPSHRSTFGVFPLITTNGFARHTTVSCTLRLYQYTHELVRPLVEKVGQEVGSLLKLAAH